MRRRLFNILSAVSLLVCVMTAVLWVRSYWVADKIQINRPAWREVATYKGRLYLAGSPNSTYSFFQWRRKRGEERGSEANLRNPPVQHEPALSLRNHCHGGTRRQWTDEQSPIIHFIEMAYFSIR